MANVYIKIDDRNRILACEGGYSSENIHDFSEWALIDEGEGDRFNHCQNNYFTPPLYTDDHIPQWAYINGYCSLRSASDIEADRAAVPKPVPSDKDYVDYYGAALGMNWDGLKWVYDRNEPVAMLVFPFPVRPNCWYRAADGKLYVGVENAWAQSADDECLEVFE